MNRRTHLLSAAALAAATLFAGAAQAQAVKLSLGHGAAPGNPRHEASLKFAEVVKAKSGGRIEVQVSPSAQLGDDAAMVTQLRTGALDLSANSQGAVAAVVPEYARLRHAFPVRQPAAGLEGAGWPAGPGAGGQVGRQGPGGAGLLGQRRAPHVQQQEAHPEARGHEGHEDAHPRPMR
jgi:hypothetical protein